MSLWECLHGQAAGSEKIALRVVVDPNNIFWGEGGRRDADWMDGGKMHVDSQSTDVWEEANDVERGEVSCRQQFDEVEAKGSYRIRI